MTTPVPPRSSLLGKSRKIPLSKFERENISSRPVSKISFGKSSCLAPFFLSDSREEQERHEKLRPSVHRCRTFPFVSGRECLTRTQMETVFKWFRTHDSQEADSPHPCTRVVFLTSTSTGRVCRDHVLSGEGEHERGNPE